MKGKYWDDLKVTNMTWGMSTKVEKDCRSCGHPYVGLMESPCMFCDRRPKPLATGDYWIPKETKEGDR